MYFVYKWPVSLIKNMERFIHNFLWTGSTPTKKLTSVPWNMCRLPISEGELGIKHLSMLNEAMLSKLAWAIISGCHKLLQHFRQRFLPANGQVRNQYFALSIWSSTLVAGLAVSNWSKFLFEILVW